MGEVEELRAQVAALARMVEWKGVHCPGCRGPDYGCPSCIPASAAKASVSPAPLAAIRRAQGALTEHIDFDMRLMQYIMDRYGWDGKVPGAELDSHQRIGERSAAAITSLIDQFGEGNDVGS